MGWKVSLLNRAVRSYDRHLYAVGLANGLVQIRRRAERTELSAFGFREEPTGPSDSLILSLTHDLKPNGTPVDWGIEPVMEMIRGMDSWADDSYFDKMLKNRDEKKADSDRQLKNEARAYAADIRKEFARRTNEFIVQN